MIHKETQDLFIQMITDMETPSFFKEMLIKDFSDLEGRLAHIKVMYGVDIDIKIKPVEQPKGRWLGKGIVEELTSFTELVNKTGN
jgi:phage regulator Rha-like protein